MSDRKKTNKPFDYRLTVQIFFFVLIAAIAVNHSLDEMGKALPVLSSASVHALCPFGGVVSIYQFASAGTYVKKTHESSFVLMIIGFLLALALGPVFCGWVCPMGSVQEWLGKLGKKIWKKRYNQFVPSGIDKVLRYLRYGVLVWVLYVTIMTGKLMFADIDPYFALFNFWSGEVALTAIIILVVVLVLSLFVERPFCKYACPYGAVLGVFNLFRVFKVKRNASTCIDCKRCDRDCPMNIVVSKGEVVRDHQCISCMKCTSEQTCPVENTVAFTTGKMA